MVEALRNTAFILWVAEIKDNLWLLQYKDEWADSFFLRLYQSKNCLAKAKLSKNPVINGLAARNEDNLCYVLGLCSYL